MGTGSRLLGVKWLDEASRKGQNFDEISNENVLKQRHDNQHNDIKHVGTQHYNIQYNNSLLLC
jgi:hypothetical protein